MRLSLEKKTTRANFSPRPELSRIKVDQMPRYYFDVHDGETFTRDDEGVELDGIEAAKAEASKTLPEIACGTKPDGNRRDYTIEVRDETGRPVLRAGLSFFVESLT